MAAQRLSEALIEKQKDPSFILTPLRMLGLLMRFFSFCVL
jgi:hypothetical protein